MRRIVYDRAVGFDLDNIYDYIVDRNPAAAGRVVDRILKTIEGLADFSTGRPGTVAGTRVKVVPGYPYVVLYAIETSGPGDDAQQTLRILTVRHTSRRPLGES